MRDGATLHAELTEVVQTTSGPVAGAFEPGVMAFKGIRYGAPPLGSLRFQPPRPPDPWTTPFAALELGAPSLQLGYPPGERRPSLGAPREEPAPNEDCLFLNVWTPAVDGGPRPVMVWLHGGGFANGSGGARKFDGANLARRGDVVVVTLNHRLNAFGYLHLGEVFGETYARSGVVGMLDIVLALEWVRDNIAAFGGDPDCVTLFGSSGGGWKTALLMTMPGAHGLFHRAIMQSGPLLSAKTREDATQTARRLLQRLGVSTAAALSQVSSAHLSRAVAGLQGDPMKLFSPVVDGDVIPRHPFEPDAPPLSQDIPLIIGANKDEHTLFLVKDPRFGAFTWGDVDAHARSLVAERGPALVQALRRAYPHYSATHIYAAVGTCCGLWGDSVRVAERKARQARAPVYMYMIAWETPLFGGRLRSPHAIDAPLVFDNVDRAAGLTGSGPSAKALADQMSSAWVAFARHGDPNTPKTPHWPAYDTDRRSTLIFDVESRVAEDPLGEVRALLSA